MWTLQRFEVWGLQLLGPDPQELNVFIVHDSESINLVDLLGNDPAVRQSLKLWDCQASDLARTTCLCRPRLPKPVVDINHVKFPILGLLDALHAAEHICVARRCVHTPRSGLYFDLEGSHNRWYLKCVLAAKWLFSNGQDTFSSRQSVSYYQLLLKQPGKVDVSKALANICWR